jgi:hypothetical protein
VPVSRPSRGIAVNPNNHRAYVVQHPNYLVVVQDDVVPHAADDEAVTREDHAVGIDVLANDAGDGVLTVTGVADPLHGTATTDGSQVLYTPDGGWSGTDTFTYPVQGSIGAATAARVTVTVTPLPVLRRTSVGAQDGWILEAGETAGRGGALDAGSTTVLVGDDAQDRQYRGVLSFNTAGLPDDAVVVAATLRVRRQGISGTNPFRTHGALLADIAAGALSGATALQLGDFRAPATLPAALTVPGTLVAGWYTAAIGEKGLSAVSTTGVTQLRLRFEKDDNDDRGADWLSIYSGNAPPASRPVLEVKYEVP